MTFDLHKAIETTETGIVQLPHRKEVILDRPLVIDRGVCIRGATMLTSQVQGNIHITTREQVILENFRHVGYSGTGIFIDYGFRTIIRNVLSENFDTAIRIMAGNSWLIEHCYILANKWGVEIHNLENADEGDATIFNCTFADPTGHGTAAVHYISSGGLRFLCNKSLGYDYGVLMETEGNTSDFLAVCNSLEGARAVHLAGRVQKGEFDNIVLVGNQFAGPGYAMTMDGLGVGACVGNVAKCNGSEILQLARKANWSQGHNQQG